MTLGLDPNEVIEADEATIRYAEGDSYNPEQNKIPKNMQQVMPFTMQTRQSSRAIPAKNYNPYVDDLVLDKIDLKKVTEELVGVEEIIA